MASPARHMAPCTLADLIVSETYILTSADIAPEKENILRKGVVPKEDGNRREHNDVKEAIAGSSTMNTDKYPPRHIPTTGVTAMMIQQATMDLELQGISLKPYKNFISWKYSLS